MSALSQMEVYMERRTRHRILGIFVVIGLVIILLPLFQSNNELSSEAVLVSAPPFPDQPADVSATSEPVPSNPAELTAPKQVTTSSTEIGLSHSDIVQSEMALNKNIVSDEPVSMTSEPIKPSSYRIIEDTKVASLFKKSERINKHIPSIKAENITVLKTPDEKLLRMAMSGITDEGLLKLKSTVWVVQIGSFKDKSNALRIVNQLRAKGYRAFIQEISSAFNNTTRVYVGPEHKQAIAHELADRLQSEMHVKGIVVSYKPLSL